jgi:hypothetical protein
VQRDNGMPGAKLAAFAPLGWSAVLFSAYVEAEARLSL